MFSTRCKHIAVKEIPNQAIDDISRQKVFPQALFQSWLQILEISETNFLVLTTKHSLRK